MRPLKGAQVQARGAWLPPLRRVRAGGTGDPADWGQAHPRKDRRAGARAEMGPEVLPT